MKVKLLTLCGCSRIINMDMKSTSFVIEVPILAPMNIMRDDLMEMDDTPVKYKGRKFEYYNLENNDTGDGFIPVYKEIWETDR